MLPRRGDRVLAATANCRLLELYQKRASLAMEQEANLTSCLFTATLSSEDDNCDKIFRRRARRRRRIAWVFWSKNMEVARSPRLSGSARSRSGSLPVIAPINR